ncbi:MAG TPA: PrsW family glutamic-type intramembrane protease [Roseiflexaceae bacterium]|nr:PrsW family glutamic-type intramembrane protease [Roseiflexaceae bacterium]
MRSRFQSATQSAVVEVIGIVIFAAVVALLAGALSPNIDGMTLIVVGVVRAVVPAAIWLTAFYRQDRLEPEPKQYVLGVFLLGAVLAQAIGQPLIRDLFQVQQWAHQNPLLGFFAAILIVGVIQEFVKYAAVRYTIFNSQEYDQPIDGIIYSAAAGLGYATTLNIQYVVSNGGVDLGIGALRVSIEALAQASSAGVIGYFLGQAKFRSMGPFWLPLGLLLAATLNGIVNTLLDIVPRLGTFGINPWYGLMAAVIVAGSTFGVLLTLMGRMNAATVRQSQEA